MHSCIINSKKVDQSEFLMQNFKALLDKLHIVAQCKNYQLYKVGFFARALYENEFQ